MPNLPSCIHSRLPLPDFDTRPKISGKVALSGIPRVFRRGLSPFRQGILDHTQLPLEPNSTTRKGDATLVLTGRAAFTDLAKLPIRSLGPKRVLGSSR